MNKYSKYTILLIVFLFFLLPCEAEEIRLHQIEQRMNSALSMASNLMRSDELGRLLMHDIYLDNLGAAIYQSRRNAETIFSANIRYSELFLTSLEYDTEAFEDFINFANIGRMPLSAYNDILDASEDLAIKAYFIKFSKADRVKVTVNTINEQGEEINHCVVWYVPYFKDDEHHKVKFDHLSTPTTDLVPAGKWKIWTEKSGKMGPKSPFNCGDDGRDRREIDILAP